MPSVTRRTRSRDRRDGVVAQVAAAVERLLAGGESYTALPVLRIAEEAGIARSTFYLYFPDKTALLLGVAEAATQDLFDAATAWATEGFDDRDALERTLRGVVGQQREHHRVLAAVMEVAAYDDEVAAFWRGRVGGFVALVAERLEAGQRAGTVAAELDPATTAAWIAWGVERLVAQHVAQDDGAGDERLAHGLATAIWATLRR